MSGDTKPLSEFFEAFERNGPPGQYIINDLLELRRRDPSRAAARKIDRDVALRAVDDRTARSLGAHALRAGGCQSDHPGRNQCARNEYPPHASDSGSAPQPRMI